MKRLTLIRHAKSDWDNASLSDFDRPLNKRGLRDAPAMAVHYARTGVKPDIIVSSPAMRAKTTASFFLDELKMNSDQIVFEPSIYEASLSSLFKVISEFNPKWEHVLMFGHNPGFSYLASELCSLQHEKVTCSISEIELFINDWKTVSAGLGKLSYFDYPKNHSELQ